MGVRRRGREYALQMLYAMDLLVPQVSNALTGKPVADLSNS